MTLHSQRLRNAQHAEAAKPRTRFEVFMATVTNQIPYRKSSCIKNSAGSKEKMLQCCSVGKTLLSKEAASALLLGGAQERWSIK